MKITDFFTPVELARFTDELSHTATIFMQSALRNKTHAFFASGQYYPTEKGEGFEKINAFIEEKLQSPELQVTLQRQLDEEWDEALRIAISNQIERKARKAAARIHFMKAARDDAG